jgi:hypothetical protein
VVSEPDATKRRDALLIWAAARERAVDELRRRAARLSREGLEDEARRLLRAAAHALHVRATQERAQAATNGPEEANTARELGGRGHSGWQSECSSKRRDSRRKVHGRGRV